MRRTLLVLTLVVAAGHLSVGRARTTAHAQIGSPAANRQLLVVLDGLRPDYVRPDIMPNLYALGQRGVVFQNHHSVYPTVTRVNASSFSTGSYPGTHGLMGNSVFFPEVDPRRFLDTSDRENLLKIDASEKGRLLTTATIGEILQKAGRRVLAVGSGSTGSATLLNYRIAGGAILHTDFAVPESLYTELNAKLGPNPPESTPNDARNRRAVDGFLQIGLPRVDPTVTMMWISDPDTTAHEHGIGHPTTIEALKREDVEIKRLQDGLAAAGLLDQYNIWVTSDHGFSTGKPGANIAEFLKPFAVVPGDGSPRIVSGGGAIYVRDHDRATIEAVVRGLQNMPGVGAIFTPARTAGSLDGRLEGTISFDAIRWAHARSADVLYSPDWSDEKNSFGFPGITAAGGVAGHGSTSAFDVHNVLMAAGPDIKERATIASPSGNVDFAPTFLKLSGVDVPESMDGRVLEEALRGGPDPARLNVESTSHTVKTADGGYSLTAFFSTVESGGGRFRYFDYTKVERR